MKTIEKSIILSLIITILLSIVCFHGNCENISKKVLRLHILANSNSTVDQNLKLKVRDRILKESNNLFNDVKDKEDAKKIVRSHLPEIKEIAEDEIKLQGFNYPVEVKLEKTYFNTRQYDDITLPAGQYEALRVLIGEGKGKNWWCVIFPSICLGSAKGTSSMEEILNDQETDIVEESQNYEIKFKIIEIFSSIENFLSKLF